MTCEHEYEPKNPAVRVCSHCGRTEYDPTPFVRITIEQAAAFGFARNPAGLLYAKYWTFPEDVYRGN